MEDNKKMGFFDDLGAACECGVKVVIGHFQMTAGMEKIRDTAFKMIRDGKSADECKQFIFSAISQLYESLAPEAKTLLIDCIEKEYRNATGRNLY